MVTVYLIVSAPAPTPVTTPEAFTVAMDGVTLLHTPPVVTSDNDVVLPAATERVPVIAEGAAGAALIVSIDVTKAVPQVLVTV